MLPATTVVWYNLARGADTSTLGLLVSQDRCKVHASSCLLYVAKRQALSPQAWQRATHCSILATPRRRAPRSPVARQWLGEASSFCLSGGIWRTVSNLPERAPKAPGCHERRQ